MEVLDNSCSSKDHGVADEAVIDVPSRLAPDAAKELLRNCTDWRDRAKVAQAVNLFLKDASRVSDDETGAILEIIVDGLKQRHQGLLIDSLKLLQTAADLKADLSARLLEIVSLSFDQLDSAMKQKAIFPALEEAFLRSSSSSQEQVLNLVTDSIDDKIKPLPDARKAFLFLFVANVLHKMDESAVMALNTCIFDRAFEVTNFLILHMKFTLSIFLLDFESIQRNKSYGSMYPLPQRTFETSFGTE